MKEEGVQEDFGFDYAHARECLDSLHALSGIDASILTANADSTLGEKRTVVPYSTGGCARCCPQAASGAGAWNSECLKRHEAAGMLSDRNDGSYTYLCPEGMVFMCAPVMVKRVLRASMMLGPVDVSEDDDEPTCHPGKEPFILRDSKSLHELTTVLSAMAAGVGDGSESYLRRVVKGGSRDARRLSKSIERSKSVRKTDYPILSERALAEGIRQADSAQAVAALDRLFAYYVAHGVYRGDSAEADLPSDLVVIISRAALEAGVASDIVFAAAGQCKREIAYTSTHEQTHRRLRFLVEEMIGFVATRNGVSFDDQIYRVQIYVQDHFSEEIRLEHVGEEVGLSPAYLSRMFSEKTGMTFVEYVNTVRIEAAKADLLATNLSLAHVAKRCGFETASYFSRVFKSHTGVTPGAFRKQGLS